jgi:hypothetical protein
LSLRVSIKPATPMFISYKNENPVKQKLERPGIEHYQVYQKTAFLFTCHIWILYLQLSDLPKEREYEHYPGKHDVVSMFLSVYHVLLHNFKFPDKLPFDTGSILQQQGKVHGMK